MNFQSRMAEAEGVPLCRAVLKVSPKKSTPEEHKNIANYYESQYYLFKKFGNLMDAASDPRLTRIEIGPYTDMIHKYDPLIKHVTPKHLQKLPSDWKRLLEFQESERYSRSNSNAFFENAYSKPMITIEDHTPLQSPTAKLIPAELKKRYPQLFLARHELMGKNRIEQKANAALNMTFSVLRALFTRGEEIPDGLSPEDFRILRKIYYEGHRLPPLKLVADTEFNFSQDPNSPHRIAMTNNKTDGEIYLNKTLLEKLDQDNQLNISDLSGILLHELSHHHGLRDDAARTPDRLGTIVTKFLEQNGQTKILDDEGKIKLHFVKFGFKPTPFRSTHDSETFLVILEDQEKMINLTSYIKSMFYSSQMPVRTSLLTLRDLDIQVKKQTKGTQQSYELEITLQHQSSTFDIDKFKAKLGFDPTAMNTTEAQMMQYFDSKPIVNAEFQSDIKTSFAGIRIYFNANENHTIRKNSLILDQGGFTPAEFSGDAAKFSNVRIAKSGQNEFTGSVELRGFDLPPDSPYALVARSLDFSALPLMGPINGVALHILKVDKMADGVRLWFKIDDSMEIATRHFEIKELMFLANHKTITLPVTSGVTFELPALREKPPGLAISAMEIRRTKSPSKEYDLFFQLENVKHLNDALLFLETEILVDNIRYEKRLVAVDLMLSQDSKAKDHFNRPWITAFQGIQSGPAQHQFRVRIDADAFPRSEVLSVRLKSLFVKDVDLRRDLQSLPEQINLLD